jgi:hypothetical protein
LNPSLLTFDAWLAQNKSRIPIPEPQPKAAQNA